MFYACCSTSRQAEDSFVPSTSFVIAKIGMPNNSQDKVEGMQRTKHRSSSRLRQPGTCQLCQALGSWHCLLLLAFVVSTYCLPSTRRISSHHIHISISLLPLSPATSHPASDTGKRITGDELQPTRARHLTKKFGSFCHHCTFSHTRLLEVNSKAKMAYPILPPNLLSTPNTYSDSVSPSDPEPITPELVSREPEKPGQKAAKTVMNNANTASKSNESKAETLPCKWTGCSHILDSPDELYDHLCTVHVGRKSTNNLCLTCGWENCGTKCVKRDHITSHLRGKFQNDS